ncbi:DUF3995 domain-containing protein [Roseibium sp. SCP14]|uniref:DUF3995 domain-containing protein n=1 Tax=Roseibium sp. SCP14 TaxID=3141375 RepID=UPI00333DFDE4
MVTSVASVLFLVLAGISALHLYWGFGGLWPARDEATLVRMVVGAKGMRQMPGRTLTVVVAGLIAIAAILPLLSAGILTYPVATVLPSGLLPTMLSLSLAGIGLIFLGRGILSYTPYFAHMQAEEPFRTLDRRYYAPLCLVLGAGFMFLVFS